MDKRNSSIVIGVSYKQQIFIWTVDPVRLICNRQKPHFLSCKVSLLFVLWLLYHKFTFFPLLAVKRIASSPSNFRPGSTNPRADPS